jgi:hypothetical protein
LDPFKLRCNESLVWLFVVWLGLGCLLCGEVVVEVFEVAALLAPDFVAW